MAVILKMYASILPVILGGVANMLFCKSSFYKRHNMPIDLGIRLKDGRRLFGDNKTIVGFISMIVFCMLFQALCSFWGIKGDIHTNYTTAPLYDLFIGFLLGYAYMLCELPNSFIKRRLDIKPGKTENAVFFVVDQIDSVLGVAFVICAFSGLWSRYFGYVVLGGLTHIAVNAVLYRAKIRKNL